MNERDLEVRLQRIESAINELYRLIEVPSPLQTGAGAALHASAATANANPMGASDAVVELIHAGKLIAAIKQQRADSGMGLADAKAYVEQVQRQL